jgi:AcrR family transcriptional regulator
MALIFPPFRAPELNYAMHCVKHSFMLGCGIIAVKNFYLKMDRFGNMSQGADEMWEMIQKSNSNNQQVQRTRSYIFEALMGLLDKKPYNKIAISDITKKAGIARQTFYRNYNNKDDVIFDYIENTIQRNLLNMKTYQNSSRQNSIVFVFNYDYMIKHRDIIKKTLFIADIESRILREVQQLPLDLLKSVKNNLSKKEYLICRYKLCYQITGCLRVIFDWFINDMPFPPDKLASMLNHMNTAKENSMHCIPNIVIRIKT